MLSTISKLELDDVACDGTGDGLGGVNIPGSVSDLALKCSEKFKETPAGVCIGYTLATG